MLAKELSVSSKAIIEKCRAEDIEVKNHMHVLTAGEIPSHNHPDSPGPAQLGAHTAAEGDTGIPADGNVLGKTSAAMGGMFQVLAYSSSDANLTPVGGAGSVADVENSVDTGHENRQPFQGVHYIIALVGVFPSRN